MSLADSADMWFILPIHIQDLKTESRIPLNNSSKVSTVILTHCHGDHIGGLLSFRRSLCISVLFMSVLYYAPDPL